MLTIAVRYGYGSTESFERAFRAVHGAGPLDVRRDGGPLRTQPRIRFHLTVEGSVPVDTRITPLSAVRRPTCGARRDRGTGRHLGGVPDRGPAPGRVAGGLGGDSHDLVPVPALAAAPWPEIVAMLAFDAEAGTATCELWLPVESG